MKYFKKILIFIISLSNLVYMTGLNVFHHICHNSNSITTTFFFESKCEHDHNDNNLTHNDIEHSACCSNIYLEKDNLKDKNEFNKNFCNDEISSFCCDNTNEFFSIEDFYNYSNIKIKFINCFKSIYNNTLLLSIIDYFENSFLNYYPYINSNFLLQKFKLIKSIYFSSSFL